MSYEKNFMSITELAKTGFPKTLLQRYVHIPGFPAKKQSPSKTSPYVIDMDKFEIWYEKFGGRV